MWYFLYNWLRSSIYCLLGTCTLIKVWLQLTFSLWILSLRSLVQFMTDFMLTFATWTYVVHHKYNPAYWCVQHCGLCNLDIRFAVHSHASAFGCVCVCVYVWSINSTVNVKIFNTKCFLFNSWTLTSVCVYCAGVRVCERKVSRKFHLLIISTDRSKHYILSYIICALSIHS